MLGIDRSYEGSSIRTAAANTSNYWQNLGMKQSPFEANSSPEYYDLPKRRELLTLLQQFSVGPKPLSLLIGSLGNGKTYLLNQFVSEIDDEIQVRVIKGDCKLELTQFGNFISEQFLLPGTSGEWVEKLPRLLSTLKGQNVLIVDDAHQLPNETLEAVMQIAINQLVGTHLRIILFGESFLKKRIDIVKERLNYPVEIPIFTLAPFTLEETKNYVKFRLRVSGLAKQDIFSEFLLQRIHELSGGFPGRINRVAQQIMVDGIKSKHTLTHLNGQKKSFSLVAILKWTLWVLILCGMGAIYSFYPWYSAAIKTELAHHKSIPINKIKKQTKRMVTVRQIPISKGPVVADEDALPSYIAPIAGLPEEVVTVTSEIKPDPSSKIIVNPIQVQNKVIALSPAAKEIPKKRPIKKIVSNDSLASKHKGYALQLMGVRDPKALQRYLNDPHIQTKANYFRTQFQGKDWYVLLYGFFETPHEAIAEIKNLPPFFRSQHPWPRPLSSVLR